MRKWAAIGGIVGPLAFISAWAVLGARRSGYDPVQEPISRLAAVGSGERAAMTTGFIVFGVGLPVYAAALREAVGGRAWMAAAGTGLATLGVAAFPLEGFGGSAAHAVSAGTGYVTLAAIPFLAAASRGETAQGGLPKALVASGRPVAAACIGLLAASTLPLAPGLFQRAGLTLGDAWVIASAVALLRDRPNRR